MLNPQSEAIQFSGIRAHVLQLDSLGAEELTQPRDVAVQSGVCRRRRGFPPQRVDEQILRDDLVRPQQQKAEQRPLTPPAERQDAAVLRHLQSAQDPEVDRSLLWSPRRYQRQGPVSDSLARLLIVADAMKNYRVELHLPVVVPEESSVG